jgi:hypothetical protein
LEPTEVLETFVFRKIIEANRGFGNLCFREIYLFFSSINTGKFMIRYLQTVSEGALSEI